MTPFWCVFKLQHTLPGQERKLEGAGAVQRKAGDR